MNSKIMVPSQKARKLPDRQFLLVKFESGWWKKSTQDRLSGEKFKILSISKHSSLVKLGVFWLNVKKITRPIVLWKYELSRRLPSERSCHKEHAWKISLWIKKLLTTLKVFCPPTVKPEGTIGLHSLCHCHSVTIVFLTFLGYAFTYLNETW